MCFQCRNRHSNRTAVAIQFIIKAPITCAVRAFSSMGFDNVSTEAQSKRIQKSWKVPTNSKPVPQLYLYNSLTRKKELFVPNHGNVVKWYICGPTVYDSSHMGHARAYLSMDILRRVMMSYFGYDVQFVMNITDIDDKIIKRARQHHLFNKYLDSMKESATTEKIVADVLAALESFRMTMKTKAIESVNIITWNKCMVTFEQFGSTGILYLAHSDLQGL
ncbi:cysteine--tRNA ligase [Dictyocaulus viviparus]|uniref:Cysteine--tRNA ligase n=1 Tax=Dictyocaulus viviparus TaxID=29172 RepID=A0A0D8Y7D5_DICVI|nr:cysteine--tRNA ligase [Dictyocaulus viviparus]